MSIQYNRGIFPKYILVISDKDDYRKKGSVWENVSPGKFTYYESKTDGPCRFSPDSYVNRETCAHSTAQGFFDSYLEHEEHCYGMDATLKEHIDWVEIPEEIYPYIQKGVDKFPNEFTYIRETDVDEYAGR